MQHHFSKLALAAIGLLCALGASARQASPSPSMQSVTIQGQKR